MNIPRPGVTNTKVTMVTADTYNAVMRMNQTVTTAVMMIDQAGLAEPETGIITVFPNVMDIKRSVLMMARLEIQRSKTETETPSALSMRMMYTQQLDKDTVVVIATTD